MDQLVRSEAGGGSTGSGSKAAPYLSPRARARMWWLKIHRWVGLATLIPMAILGVTGSAQVWPEETEALLNPQREVAATADPAEITTEHGIAAREALEPYGPISQIQLGEPGEPIIASTPGYADPPFGIGPPGSVSRQVWVDPDSAQVIDSADSAGGFMWYMHFIHGLFLIPGWGRQLVGIMGLFLTISAVTGIYIFWPGRKRVMAALRWHKRDGKSLNLHRQSGFLLSLVIIIEAITGAWISFPGFFAMLVEPGVEQPERRRGGFGGPEGELQVMSDREWIAALDRAQAAWPGRPQSIAAPVGKDGSWSVALVSEGMNGNVTVPTGSGEIAVEESPVRSGPPPAPTRASAVSMTMRQVHYATIGGIVWEILVFLSGIALTFLALSGVYVWAKRKLRRSRRSL